MSRASERLRWAAERLDVRPGDRLLELGCGHGVVVSLVCEKLAGGHIVALDRSATMTAATARRNRAHVEAGRASVLTAALHEAPLGAARFDTVFGIHFPPLLRGDPGRELATIRRHLEPDGRLLVLFQPLDAAGVAPALERLRAVLPAHGFRVRSEDVDPLAGTAGVCVVAAPAQGAGAPEGAGPAPSSVLVRSPAP
jgi:ubiquinone/menaquinone biosynthesis C-methylase UbiE